jgi:hypothetical protein
MQLSEHCTIDRQLDMGSAAISRRNHVERLRGNHPKPNPKEWPKGAQGRVDGPM